MEYKTNPVPERVTKMRLQWAASDAKRDAGLTEPEDLEKFRNISYGPYDDWNLLDVYVPKGNKPFPVILNVHGGGYFYGDKNLYRFYCMRLAKAGFAVVNINYRLSPEFRFPAPIEDVMAVMHWIGENSEKFGLDPQNVFMVGDSAGAQITSQFACVFTNPRYADLFGLKAPANVKLRAISLACGMYRLPKSAPDPEKDLIMLDYLGDKAMMEDPRVELHNNITSDYPPTYIFSCYNDFLLTECKPMADFLASRNIEVESCIYGSKEAKEVGHVFHCNMYLEEGEKANMAQLTFFKKHFDKE